MVMLTNCNRMLPPQDRETSAADKSVGNAMSHCSPRPHVEKVS